MKRRFLAMLILLVVFYATPRLACLCNSVVESFSTAQSCCEQMQQSCCDDSQADVILRLEAGCCGQVGASPMAAANPLSFIEQHDSFSKQAQTRFWNLKISCANRTELIGVYNKAPPPFLKAIGGSDTYLYKRVLLI